MASQELSLFLLVTLMKEGLDLYGCLMSRVLVQKRGLAAAIMKDGVCISVHTSMMQMSYVKVNYSRPD